jgi:hypothetical protein
MIATLTFTLPEENHEHLCAIHGGDAISALWDIQQLFRNEYKYNNTHTETEYELIEKLQEGINGIINEYGLPQLIEG